MNENLTWDQLDHGDVHHLLSLECLNCALNQLTATTEMVKMPEKRRRELMQEAFETLARKGRKPCWPSALGVRYCSRLPLRRAARTWWTAGAMPTVGCLTPATA